MKLNQPYKKEVFMFLNEELINHFNSLAEATEYIKNNTNYKKADYSTIAKSIKNNWNCYGFKFKYTYDISV